MKPDAAAKRGLRSYALYLIREGKALLKQIKRSRKK